MGHVNNLRNVWTPGQMATLGWWDAADSATITESLGEVSQWDDKSGNGKNLAQGAGANQPDTGATLNGLTALNFDGGDFLSITDTWLEGKTSLGIIALFDNDDSSIGNRVIWGDGTSGDNTLLLRFDSSGYFGGGTDLFKTTVWTTTSSSNSQVETSTSSASLNPIILNHNWVQGTGSVIRINGSVDTPAYNAVPSTGTTASTPGFFIGRGASDSIIGKVAEVIAYSGAASGDVERLEGYLAWKWGQVANLPAAHAYKNHPPYV